jgi:hypothetical protein
MTGKQDLLHELYYSDLNFDGVNVLYTKAKKLDSKITIQDVKDFLKDQTNNQITKRKIGKKIFKPIFSNDYYSYQIDLTFLPIYKFKNSNNDVLFTAININSRYAYAYYGKDKTTSTILTFMNKF